MEKQMVRQKIIRTQAASAAIKQMEEYRDSGKFYRSEIITKLPSGILCQLEESIEYCASDWNSGHRKKRRLPKGASVFVATKEYLKGLGLYGCDNDCLTGTYSDVDPETFYDRD